MRLTEDEKNYFVLSIDKSLFPLFHELHTDGLLTPGLTLSGGITHGWNAEQLVIALNATHLSVTDAETLVFQLPSRSMTPGLTNVPKRDQMFHMTIKAFIDATPGAEFIIYQSPVSIERALYAV